MMLETLRRRAALALSPELRAELDAALSVAVKFKWLIQERALIAPIPSDAPKRPESPRCQGSPSFGLASEPEPGSIPGSAGPANRDPEMREGVSQASWLEAPALPFVSRPIDGATLPFRYHGVMA